MTKPRAMCFKVAMAAIACLVATGASAQNLTDDKIDSALSAKAGALSSEDKIRIIVEFEIPVERSAAMRTGASDAERQATIADARAAMFAALSETASLRADMQGNVRREMSFLPYVAMEVTRSQLEELSRNPRVVKIHADGEVQLFLPESTGVNLIDAITTRSMGIAGQGKAVAIIDSGVFKNHSFIGAGRVVAEACYASDCTTQTGPGAGEPGIGAPNYHGTHVAGIAAGSDTLTFSGVAPEADIIAVRVFPAVGGGSFSDVVAGLEFVYNNRNNYDVAAVNMSLDILGLSFTSTCDTYNAPVTDAINLLDQADIAVVVSSGNDGFTNGISFPACVTSAISVGATNDGSSETPLCVPNGPDTSSFDQVSSYSNSASFIDLLAPGTNIRSSHGLPNEICNLRGTSMAAPHVAGAFAVLKGAVPSATTQDILNALIATGKPITDLKSPSITKPRIDVYEALQYLQGQPSQPRVVVVPLNGFTVIPLPS